MCENFKELGFSIILEAINDYRLLKEIGASEINLIDEGIINMNELENFFQSDWCDFLLSNLNITGNDILDYFNRE